MSDVYVPPIWYGCVVNAIMKVVVALKLTYLSTGVSTSFGFNKIYKVTLSCCSKILKFEIKGIA